MLLLVCDDGRCCYDKVSTSSGEDDGNRMKGSNDMIQQLMETSVQWRCADLVVPGTLLDSTFSSSFCFFFSLLPPLFLLGRDRGFRSRSGFRWVVVLVEGFGCRDSVGTVGDMGVG